MSAESLRTAFVAAIHGITPTWETATAWTEYDPAAGPLDPVAGVIAPRTFAIDDEGPPSDDGYCQGEAIDSALMTWALRVAYPCAEPYDRRALASMIRADAIDLANALRPPSVWQSHVLDVQLPLVLDDAADILSPDGIPAARVLSIPIIVRYLT